SGGQRRAARAGGRRATGARGGGRARGPAQPHQPGGPVRPADGGDVSEQAGSAATERTRVSAPIGRLLGSEVRWLLRRPRTLVMLGLFALMPVTIAIGVVASNRSGGLVGNILGNGLVLPVVALILAQALLLPLAVGMAAADALAGESAAGTLRGLLIAPVSRLRLVGMKAFGVLVVAVLATGVIAVVGALAGIVIVGGAGHFVTLSGTTLGVGDAAARLLLILVWSIGQLAAIG